MVALLLICSGCEQRENESEQIKTTENTVRVEEVFRTAIRQYSTAETYQDNAVLYLTYRLNGRAIQEPHPWSIAWNRNGRYAADLFNAKIRCNGEKLSCYVFDIETGNIDNQHLLVDADKFAFLLDDQIAGHFIFGTSELPLDETEAETNNQLVPPMIGFLEPELMPRWLKQPDHLERLEDDQTTGASCFVIDVFSNTRNYRIWIDQSSGMIRQIQLPLEYLDSQILASSQVTDLRFFVRFHDAKLDAELTGEQTTPANRLASKTVKHFVMLPQPLPCESLGDIAEEIRLFHPTGERVDGAALTNKATALLWFSANNPTNVITGFAEAATDLADDAYAFGIVYSDDGLREPATNSFEMIQEIKTEIAAAGVPAYFDRQMQSSSILGIKAVPCVIVLDTDRRVQFAKAIDSEGWVGQLKVAMKRIAAGENVSYEMKQEYQRFLDEYHQQLVVASADTQRSDQWIKQVEQTSIRDLNLEWEIDSLKNPGNIHVPFGSKKIFVIDGWQTVVEIDSAGRVQKSYSLDLPPGTAVNRIRSCRNSQNEIVFVAFSMLGKRAFVFDQDWNQMFQFPERDEKLSHQGISECQLFNAAQAKTLELWISFVDGNGIKKVELSSGSVQTFKTGPCKSFYKTAKHVFSLSEEGLCIDSNEFTSVLSDWKLTSVRPDPTSSDRCLVVGEAAEESWKLFCVSSSAIVKWSTPIGSQFFDNEIDPIAFSIFEEPSSIAVVSKDHFIKIINGSGEDTYEIHTDFEIAGIARLVNSGKTSIILSHGSKMSAWNRQLSKPTIFPISSATER